MFFSWEKHIISHFEITNRFAQDNLDVKKVSVPSKTPQNGWLCVLLPKKHKILHFKNSGTLVVKMSQYVWSKLR
jgi:hypothetical protein